MKINVEQFIKDNYKEYTGTAEFLRPLTARNKLLWDKCKTFLKMEKEEGGVLSINTRTFSGINNFKPAYVDKSLELIVGFQGDKPLERIINPYGGIRMVEQCLKVYDCTIDNKMLNLFKEVRKTHNEGVFDAYTPEVKRARHNGLITGLPDAYGRGRIIGDYRRVALYGIDALIKEKEKDLDAFRFAMNINFIQLREEISMQIKALKEMKEMALSYGVNISQPAQTAQGAIQALYFAYLAGAKENNGAATSLGRVSTFLDIFIEKDIEKGILDEDTAQELIDQFIMKLRFIRHLRTPEYDELFAGDPTWVTESIGGMCDKEKSYVTKTSYRFLHSLINLGAAPEPNMTILWHRNLPTNFKNYCLEISEKTNAIQYVNDDLMRDVYGEDFAVACCVSGMKLGEQMQFFGARCNLAKVLLYAINGGRDEITGELVIPHIPSLENKILDFDEVYYNFRRALDTTIRYYIQANNTIHYMHDKYAYESAQMALHDSLIDRLMAFGIAGFSVLIDSLSAIQYAKVKPIRDERGIATGFDIQGSFPFYGTDDDRVDNIGKDVLEVFKYFINRHDLYRGAKPTVSILTITSNIVYGKKTGATPDGRLAGKPFAPGANPLHGRDSKGALASLNSVAKMPYKNYCEDGISNTFTISPINLPKDQTERTQILTAIVDTYFEQKGHHLNINVLSLNELIDAYYHPENYPTLTIRVSGYAVKFNSLTQEQKKEILERTFHIEL